MSMGAKSRKVVVRITESQARWLTKAIIQEHKTKSQIIRAAINDYLVENLDQKEIVIEKM
jgi:metal-responsive CopG/Arc/MetJ family transcriptional regulator